MRISDWSSDVCSSDLAHGVDCQRGYLVSEFTALQLDDQLRHAARLSPKAVRKDPHPIVFHRRHFGLKCHQPVAQYRIVDRATRSEEHTSELQSLMRISYAVFCLKKKTTVQIT